jgi:hypothetical protein
VTVFATKQGVREQSPPLDDPLWLTNDGYSTPDRLRVKSEPQEPKGKAGGDLHRHGDSAQLRAPVLGKLSATLKAAIRQLDCEDPHHEAWRIVFTVLNFDDWVGDRQTEYIGQLDAHLLANPVEGAELVF